MRSSKKGIENNSINPNQIKVKVKLEIKELDLSHEIEGEIHLEDEFMNENMIDEINNNLKKLLTLFRKKILSLTRLLSPLR